MKTAQEAFEASLKNIDGETDAIMVAVTTGIEKSIEMGLFTTTVGPFKVPLLEKVSLELTDMGYYTSLINAPNPYFSDGTLAGTLIINWKLMPQNMREKY